MKEIILYLVIVLSSSTWLSAQNKVTDKDLSPMNRVKMDMYVNLSNDVQGPVFNILIIGNSITLHGRAENIGWYTECGMAASSPERDYVHILFRKIEGLMPDRKINMRLSNAAVFERDIKNYDFGNIDKIKQGYKPDLIIFQLSENVPSGTDMKLFEAKYSEFINRFKKGNNTITLCTTPFFPVAERSVAIRKVALNTNSFLIDLSSLVLLDKKNQAKNDPTSPLDKSKWKVEGIGIHPGDYGMENIAETMFVAVKAIINCTDKHKIGVK